jgi:hypothetical protein
VKKERFEMQCPKQYQLRGEKRGVRNILSCVFCLFLILGFFPKGGYASLSISPALLEVNLEKGRPAGQFIISNVGDEEERYRIGATHFSLSKTGNVSRVEPDEHSLAPWIKFNPTEFTLAPRSQQAVRYVITPPPKLRAGEYWGAMELESLKAVKGSSTDTGGREYQIEVIPSILVPIFGTVGSIRYEGNVKEVQVIPKEEKKMIVVSVENTGEGRLRIEGTYEIRNISGAAIEKGPLARSYVFPGVDQLFTTALKTDLKEGSYTVRVEFRSPQLKQPIADDFPIVWKPPL